MKNTHNIGLFVHPELQTHTDIKCVLYVIVTGIQTPHSAVFYSCYMCILIKSSLPDPTDRYRCWNSTPWYTFSRFNLLSVWVFRLRSCFLFCLSFGCIELRCKRRDHHMTALPEVSRDFRFHTTTLARQFRPSRDRAVMFVFDWYKNKIKVL